jgi:carboxyl-terminal processing protease
MNGYLADFDEIHAIVTYNYCHLENKNIEPLYISNKYKPLVYSCKEDVEYTRILLRYFADLQNDHSIISFSTFYGIECGLKLLEGKIFVDKIYDKKLYNVFKEKDEILKVDTIDSLQWINENKKYTCASTDTSRISRTVNRIISDPFPIERTLLIRSGNDIKESRFKFSEISFSPLKNYSRVINDKIGYIALNSMMYEFSDFTNEFFQVKDLPYLIIDVRNNMGGNSGTSEKIFTYLIKEPQKASVSEAIIQPNKDRYRGKLVLLTDVKTASAAESFVLDIKESGNSVIIGSPTSGDTGNRPRKFETKKGTSFIIPTHKPPQISPKGFPMEGIGIPPNYIVEPNINDFLNDIDTVVEFVLKKINNDEL